MKAIAATIVVALVGGACGSESTPIVKVLELLSNLQGKVTAEGEAAKKTYDEFAAYCEDRSKDLNFDIKTGKSDVAELQASIELEEALASKLSAKIQELGDSIGTDTADLEAATAIRKREGSDFAAEEKEQAEVISTLQRAIAVLEKEMQRGGASMMQLARDNSIVEALETLVQASTLNTADVNKLTALLQSDSRSSTTDELDDFGAPAAAAYGSHSGGIIDTLEDLLGKAQEQLSDARKKETTSTHNFQLLKQSLEDKIKVSTKEAAASKANLAESSEKKAVVTGDLDVTSKDLAEDIKTLEDMTHDCMTKAEDFESETKSRAEELKALGAAKTAVQEATGAAAHATYSFAQVSFFQTRRSQSDSLKGSKATRLVRDMARNHKSVALAHLASRIASAMGASNKEGADPFGKVKGLIRDMIDRLEDEASADATQKAYCDKETSESNEAKEDLSAAEEKLSLKIDQMTARKTKLREQVASLQNSLAKLSKSQADMDELRKEELAAYVQNKADLQQGIEGVKIALKVLREYYAKDDKAHDAADGGADGIVGLLEVIESDFSKGLAETVATEEGAKAAYEAETKENEIEKAAKNKDVDYKSKEAVRLEKAASAASSDRGNVQTELDAVLEYLTKLESMCVAKPESYEEKTRQRQEEIEGLQTALNILEGDASLLQTTERKLRGVRQHA
jgi:DNA repair exonuclease SbcCD ATPase subunit